jgi:hypothetical protein
MSWIGEKAGVKVSYTMVCAGRLYCEKARRREKYIRRALWEMIMR